MKPSPNSASLRSVVSLLFVAALAVAACSKSHRTALVKFEPYSDAALEAAGKQGKPAVVYATADWCGYCEILDNGTLSEAKVKDALEPLARLEINCTERSEVNQALLAKYGVKGLPTLIFFDRQGKEIARLVGDQGVETILDVVKKAGGP